ILYNNPSYALKSELEFNGGYADVAILPDHVHHLNHYYLFELKYLPAGEVGGKSILTGELGGKTTMAEEAVDKIIPADGVGETAIEAKLREARGQLQRYMKDPLVSQLANLHMYIIVASLRGVLKVEEMDE
ncbi:MAG: PD-(D/E)XK nuclease domain-containing protein, partial [Lachnospiraceae bacterium]|nr:PD-(D/E)XK nuclease domain-containing protein [Lachnospiraceae bacterium]